MVAARQHFEDWHTVATALPLSVPFPLASAILTSASDDWLPHAAEAYEHERDTMLATVGLGGMLAPIRRTVRVTIGPRSRTEHSVRVHLGWEAASQARLFPVMDGYVTLTRDSVSASVLEVRAYYLPPLGLAGRLADRALLHLVAAGSIRRFAQDIAAGLEALATKGS